MLADLVGNAQFAAGLAVGVAACLAGLWFALPRGLPAARGVRAGLLLPFGALAALVVTGRYAHLQRGVAHLADSPVRVAFVAAAAAVAVALTADFDRHRGGGGLTVHLLLLSAGGVYATVPEPETARAVVGLLVPFAAVALVWPVVAEPRGAAGVAVALVWAIVAGGWPRGSALVGGFASFGMLAAEPVGRRLARTVVRRSRSHPTAILVVAHAAGVAVASRVAGLAAHADDAAVIALAAFAGLVVIAVVSPAPKLGAATCRYDYER